MVLEETMVIENVALNIVNKEVPLRRSQRTRWQAIFNDYMVCLQKNNYDMNDDSDPINFSKAISCVNSIEWVNAIKNELALVHHNDVWGIKEVLNKCEPVDANGFSNRSKMLMMKLRSIGLDL